jgi:tetratricopeptide (TPR) repeat protein
MARFGLGGGPRTVDSTVFALLRAVVALAGTAFVLMALSYSGYLGYTDLDGPELEVEPSAFDVDETGRQLRYGRSTLSRNGRLWTMQLQGTPEQIGDAHGHLGSRLIGELDDQVQPLIDARYGSMVEQWTAAMLLRWDYRGADAFVDDPARRELAALAAAVPDVRTDRASAYHRLFMYQCFHSLARRLEDVVLEGSMFAVAPKRSKEGEPGNLLIGRTLSVDLGRDFELDRVVTVYKPDGRYPFVSVGWAGLTGVVTGINARGVFVAVNAARTDDPLEEGAPLPLVLRRVLEEADSLDRAVAILREAELRTSGIVLVGDGAARKSVVLELAARKREDRRTVRGEDEAMVWATDHMIKEAFESDLQNDWVKRYTSSGYRYDRLSELLQESSDIDPPRAAKILRDRRGVGGTPLGLGNRNALENLDTTHSVIVDATAMVMWVGEGPSTLGRYQAFDLKELLGREDAVAAPLDDLPADPLLHSEEYRDFEEAVASVEHARKLLSQGYPQRALWSAQVALALAPDIGELYRLLGDIERELGHPEAAVEHYRRYLELVPGHRRDQVRVEGIIAELES